jgi:hypothetical protein
MRRPLAVVSVIAWIVLSLARPSSAVDSDGNGFDDEVEIILATKFCPSFRLQEVEGIRPMPIAVASRTHTFASFPATQLWHMILDVNGKWVGEWRGDDPGWPYYWLDGGRGDPDWNYSWVSEPLEVFVDPPGDAIYWRYWDIVHVDWGGPDIDETGEWSSLYNSNAGNASGHPGRYYKSTTYAHLFWCDSLPVVQYWFFYPFNDWVNNHEGDWEHINVVMTSADPGLAGVSMVEYYFHRLYLQRDPILGQLYLTDTTHPVVFVGGHGECPDIGTGNVSGGSYPIFGTWQDVGPGIFLSCDLIDDALSDSGSFVRWSDVHVEVLPNIGSIDFSERPDMGWIKANLPWGTINPDSPGDWFVDSFRDVGNDPPAGPCWNHDCWEHLGPGTNQTRYQRQAPYDPVQASGWTPPPAGDLSVTLLKPNQSATLRLGENTTIVWTTTDDGGIEFVDILLSMDDGSSYPVVISEGYPDVWSFPWTIGPSIAEHCRVKVIAHDGDGHCTADVSDESFSIVLPGAHPGDTPSIGCPYVSVWNGSSFAGHNTALSPAGTAADRTDRRDTMVFERARDRDGVWRVEIAEFEGDSVFIDEVRAYEISTAASCDGLVCSRDSIWEYSVIGDLELPGDDPGSEDGQSTAPVSPRSLLGGQGTFTVLRFPCTREMESTADLYLLIVAQKKNTLPVLPPEGEGVNLVPAGPSAALQEAGIVVRQNLPSEGACKILGTVVPRENQCPFLVGPLAPVSDDPGLVVSLDFRTSHQVDRISVVRASTDGVRSRQCRLLIAEKADGGDATGLVECDDSRHLVLAAADRLGLSFQREGPADCKPSALAVVLDGYYLPRDLSKQDPDVSDAGEPGEVRILSVAPNPFSDILRISYQSPGEPVDVTVYDVAGRCVMRMHDGSCATDMRTAVWDRRDPVGKHIRSGVYFVKVSTSTGMCYRKVVLCQ